MSKVREKYLRDEASVFKTREAYELHLDVGELLDEIAALRAGIIKARDALDNYDQDTSLFDIMSELDELLGDTE